MSSKCILYGNNEKNSIYNLALFIMYTLFLHVENIWKIIPQLLTNLMGGSKIMEDSHSQLYYLFLYCLDIFQW